MVKNCLSLTLPQNIYLLLILPALPSATCKQHFYVNISCKYRKCFLSASPSLHSCPPSVPASPVCLHTQSLLASDTATAPLPHTHGSIQPSQPPTHSLGMNRSEKLSCIIKCAKALLNMTTLDVEEFDFFFEGGGSECSLLA